jgi:hypothetical protein
MGAYDKIFVIIKWEFNTPDVSPASTLLLSHILEMGIND